MTWFADDKRTWSQKLFGNVLAQGPLPKHVAIIMDGNRRFARVNNLKKIEGHISGFDKLVEALNWCFMLGICEVTVYAFSIENFKRSPEEVNGLFDLAREKFKRLLEEKEKIDQLGVCVRVFGEMNLLPPDLEKILAQVIQATHKNNKLFMNVCIAYTSRQELTCAVKDICKGVEDNTINISDINEDLIEKSLYTNNSHEIDLLVRTSGEVRLSDFLLWQTNYSVISFVKQMWPEFTIWNFYLGLINYQMNYDTIQKFKKLNKLEMQQNIELDCKMQVIENRRALVDQIKQEQDELESDEMYETRTRNLATEAIQKSQMEHEQRKNSFILDLNERRLNRIIQVANAE